MNRDKLRVFIALHVVLMVYSTSTICSKMAAKQGLLSFKFCFFYGLIILLLGLYAVGWQQIIKRLPLTTAFANKAVTVIWGLVWGRLFFSEPITMGKMIGVILVVIGIVVFAKSDEVPNSNEGLGETK